MIRQPYSNPPISLQMSQPQEPADASEQPLSCSLSSRTDIQPATVSYDRSAEDSDDDDSISDFSIISTLFTVQSFCSL